ncbi:MAG TPA: SulP family inorganic anion transporter [Caulobacteraceae bacterium]
MTAETRPARAGVRAAAPRWPAFRSFAGYRAGFVAPDVMAGLTLAAIAIPEQMATARLAALPPQFGFFAFIAGTLGILVLGSNRRMSVGADSTITPVIAGGLVLIAASGSAHYAAMAAALSLMVGAIIVVAGCLRMGWIADLLSIPVVTGFLAGIAIHIIVSQLPGALGLATGSGSIVHRLSDIWRQAPHINLYAAAIAASVLALTAGAHLLSARIPGPLIAMGLATWAVISLGLQDKGVAVLGAVQGGLPRISLPAASADQYAHLLPLALLVALIAMVQTAATARSFPPEGGDPPDIDRDYIGLGAGSLLAGLIGALPVNASPPRTAIVAESGGRSQLAGLTAAAIVVVLLAVGAKLLTHVPQAALSGVLLFVALRIVRVSRMRQVLSGSLVEFSLIVATAGAIVMLPIENGVAIGIGLSLLHGVWSSARPGVYPMQRAPGTTVWWPAAGGFKGEVEPGVSVLGFQAPLSFLNAYGFRRQVLAAARLDQGDVSLMVIEAAGIVDIDFTGAEVFKEIIAACQKAKVTLAVARLESVESQTAFTRMGLRALVGEDHVFDSVEEAIDRLRK